MRTAVLLAALALLLAAPAPAPAAPDQPALAKALAQKLFAEKALRPRTHATDFGTDRIGCITLTTWELRRFGYRGHAFLCEEGQAGEVLGAVLNRYGVVRCYIHGMYAGDTCYDFEICGVPETACVYR
jgi:hypothetical protein